MSGSSVFSPSVLCFVPGAAIDNREVSTQSVGTAQNFGAAA